MSTQKKWAPVAEALRGLADAVATLDDVAPGCVDQAASPLGRRKHCAAVRRRIGRGEGDAFIVGRRHLLGTDALREELSRGCEMKKTSAPESVTERLDSKLRLLGSSFPR